MSGQSRWYRKAFANAFGGETPSESIAIDYLSDTIKCALATSSYSPDLDTHEFFSDITNEVSGQGYTAGGVTLTNKTSTYTPANSWGVTWSASTAYAVGDVVRPTTGNGRLYRCIIAGTSGSSQPSWPTVSGQTVSDGTVTWAECGAGIWVLDADNPEWSNATITARYAIIYKSTGTPSTSPLMGLIDFGQNVSSTNATFTVQFNANQGALSLTAP